MENRKEILFEDDFRDGFNAGMIEDGMKWNYMKMGPIEVDPDAYVVDLENGLKIIPKEKNLITGEPAFIHTAEQHPLTGQVDHLKWTANINHKTNTGMQGFDVVSGKKINFEAVMGGRTFGTENHPFGDAVKDPNGDLRLAGSILMVLDQINSVIFDFYITNNTIYAIYERGKSMVGNQTNYAAYSFGIPVAKRKPEDFNLFRITYDQDSNTVSWFIDDELVYQVERVGMLIDRKYMYIDNGGEGQEVRSQVFNAGLGLFTLMDGAIDGVALVNLLGTSDFYNPLKGAPEQVKFVDSESKKESRLFGQGAEVRCKKFNVFYS